MVLTPFSIKVGRDSLLLTFAFLVLTYFLFYGRIFVVLSEEAELIYNKMFKAKSEKPSALKGSILAVPKLEIVSKNKVRTAVLTTAVFILATAFGIVIAQKLGGSNFNFSDLWGGASPTNPSSIFLSQKQNNEFYDGDYNALGAGFVYEHPVSIVQKGGVRDAWRGCEIVDGQVTSQGNIRINENKTSAIVTCQVFDANESGIWIGLRLQSTTPENTNINVRLRSRENSFNQTDAEPAWQTYETREAAQAIYDPNRYSQFQIELIRQDVNITSPQLKTAKLGYVNVDCSNITTCELTHGPILSTNWNATAMKVFVRTDLKYQNDAGEDLFSTAPVRVTYKKQADQDWQITDYAMLSAATDYTNIFEIPVDPVTRYEYKIVINDKTVGPASAFTSLPVGNSGQFVLFHGSDSHGANDNWPNSILNYYEEHYPNTMPAAVVYTGDLFVLGNNDLNPEGLANKYKQLYETASFANLFSQMPLYYMWDDWDFFSDNSNINSGNEEINSQGAVAVRQLYLPYPRREWWEGNDPSAGYYVKLGNVPLIVADQRSQKMAETTFSEAGCVNELDGSQTDANRASAFGLSQLDWIKQALYQNRNSNLKIFVSTQSFQDNLELVPNPCYPVYGERDSFGLYYKAEKISLIRYLLENNAQNGFVVWSGDDHDPKINKRSDWRAPYNVFGPNRVPEPDPDLFAPFSSPTIYDFKAGPGRPVSYIYNNQDYKPFWWGGCKCKYSQTEIPEANSTRADIGFVWTINYLGNNVNGNVKAILLEKETKQCEPTDNIEQCYQTENELCENCRTGGTELMNLSLPLTQ